MTSIGNYVAEITITLQDSEVAELVGIDNDDAKLAIAYDAIDWDGIEDALGDLARTLVEAQATRVRMALEGKDADGDDEVANGVVGRGPYDSCEVWVRFGVGGDFMATVDVDDIRPALDRIPIDELPAWAEEFHEGACGYGDRLFAEGIAAGAITGDDANLEGVFFDGIDERAYEDYYDGRRQREGLIHLER